MVQNIHVLVTVVLVKDLLANTLVIGYLSDHVHSSSQSRSSQHFAGWLITLPAGEVLRVEFADC